MDRPFLEVRWMDHHVEQFPMIGGSWTTDERRDVLIIKHYRRSGDSDVQDCRDEIPLRNVRLYTVYPIC